VFERLREAIDAVGAVVAALDASVLDGAGARRYLEEFARGGRLMDAGRALAAGRVEETAAFDRSRHRSAAHYLAKVAGTTITAAESTIKTAKSLGDLGATEEALRAGALSSVQVNLVAEAAAADPSAEAQLLASAERDQIKGLKKRCDRVKAAASQDAEKRYERARRERALRHWAEDDVTGRIDVRGPIDLTSRIAVALEPYEQELFDAQRKARPEAWERHDALMFDALVAMADASVGAPTAPVKAPKVTMTVRVDHRVLLDGATEPGDVCEITGVGPIPGTLAQRLADDAILKALLTDGVDVLAVAHLGRTIPAHLRTALDELFPECALEGCNATFGLEIDHNQPIEHGGPTALWNLNKLCRYHHQEKHRRDLRLIGDGTNKRFVPAAEWMPPERSAAPLAAV
jgi:hypothetical protein